ncbi:esterase-like activity of phytase family protein [Pseudomonas gingeri]|uniref:esterase-like activity of phytase family protein n=1 Tax=Pseudomonas gingeri TaxID=117681 RepID=UPI0015A1D4B2|nr:esterase-like activity of phytase family protein [Pseudomonas gingeri]NVZ65291.1 esterase-like activity of phytase family protein [Pseudomonas gingeri]NVZ74114.1 esterase-like activity of phytase family protein [Pseudomonas gingeri]
MRARSVFVALLLGGAQLSALPVNAVSAPEIIDLVDLPAGLRVGGTVVGGLSGLDYDPGQDRWYFITDEHSLDGAGRLYSGSLERHGRRHDLKLNATWPLSDCKGQNYVPLSQNGPVSDGEAVRVDPQGGLLWSSEGYYKRGIGPSISFSDKRGRCTAELSLPRPLQRDPAGRSGPRSNKSFEGLAFDPGGQSFWVSVEDALLQDGPLSSLQQGGLTRLSRLDRQGNLLQQFAYRLDPIQAPGVGGIADNGISEILLDGSSDMLVLERSGAKNKAGAFDFRCRLYRVSLEGGTDISNIGRLAEAQVKPLSKTLVFDFGRQLSLRPYNFEGMAWGPRLPDGRRLLVMVSDNGFETVNTKLLLLAVP